MTRNQIAYQSMLQEERQNLRRLDFDRDVLAENRRHNLRGENQKDVEIMLRGAEVGSNLLKNGLQMVKNAGFPSSGDFRDFKISETPNTGLPIAQ